MMRCSDFYDVSAVRSMIKGGQISRVGAILFDTQNELLMPLWDIRHRMSPWYRGKSS